MEELPITLDDLVASVDRPDSEPLDVLTDAVIVSRRVGDLADQVVDHFVQRAREAGASWADIGHSLGVSKQAAQKRFTGERGAPYRRKGAGLFTRFDEAGRQAVEQAVSRAHSLGSPEINTLHLVMGLADPASGRAHDVISNLAGPPAMVEEAARNRLTGPKGARKVRHHPFADDCKKVLELSLREAIRARSRRIGSEYVLLGLLRSKETLGAVVLEGLGVSRGGVETWLEENPVTDH